MKKGTKVYYIGTSPQGHRLIQEAKYIDIQRDNHGRDTGKHLLETIPHQLYAPGVKPPLDYKPEQPKEIAVPENDFFEGPWINTSKFVVQVLQRH